MNNMINQYYIFHVIKYYIDSIKIDSNAYFCRVIFSLHVKIYLCIT